MNECILWWLSLNFANTGGRSQNYGWLGIARAMRTTIFASFEAITNLFRLEEKRKTANAAYKFVDRQTLSGCDTDHSLLVITKSEEWFNGSCSLNKHMLNMGLASVRNSRRRPCISYAGCRDLKRKHLRKIFSKKDMRILCLWFAKVCEHSRRESVTKATLRNSTMGLIKGLSVWSCGSFECVNLTYPLQKRNPAIGREYNLECPPFSSARILTQVVESENSGVLYTAAENSTYIPKTNSCSCTIALYAKQGILLVNSQPLHTWSNDSDLGSCPLHYAGSRQSGRVFLFFLCG